MDLKESKQKLDMIIIVGLEINESLGMGLRTFFNTFKYSDLNKGDTIFNPYKNFEGKFFENESQFILYNKSKGSQDLNLTHLAINDLEIKTFLKLCKEYGVDVLYMKRPDNLEELFYKFEKGEPLSENQKNIVEAFTIKNENGDYKLKNDASLICFNVKDFDVMERVLDKLEEKTMNIAKRREKAQQILHKMKENKKAKSKEKDKEVKEVK